jgi:hypothetical protein
MLQNSLYLAKTIVPKGMIAVGFMSNNECSPCAMKLNQPIADAHRKPSVNTNLQWCVLTEDFESKLIPRVDIRSFSRGHCCNYRGTLLE